MKISFFLLISMSCASAFHSGLLSSFALTKHLTHDRVDDSHNHVHAIEVLFWANEIMRAHPVSRYEADAAGHCALLHDLLDNKYDIPGAVASVKDHLTVSVGYSDKVADDLMRVMTSISYHKTMSGDSPVFPEWLTDEHPFIKVFHITRDADLLASFNLARMVEFRRHHKPEMHSEQIADEVIELYDHRMDTLLDRSAFFHDESRSIGDALVRICRLRRGIIPVALHLESLDILRIVNHLDPYAVIADHESLACLDRFSS